MSTTCSPWKREGTCTTHWTYKPSRTSQWCYYSLIGRKTYIIFYVCVYKSWADKVNFLHTWCGAQKQKNRSNIIPKFNRLTDEQQQHSFNVWIDGWMEENMLGFFFNCYSQSTVYGQQPYWGVGKLREWNSIYLVLVRRLFHPHIESNYFGATFFRSFAGVFFHFWMQCISLPASLPACLFAW